MSLWIGFNLLVLVFLAIDLFVHRKARTIAMKEALLWSALWIALALLFNAYIYLTFGETAGTAFLTGYLVEKALSIDNLFVFVLIFHAFQTPPHVLHRVLFFGVIGAIIMRALFIFLGISFIRHFDWAFYLFGLFLLVMGVKFLFEKAKTIHPEKNIVLKLFRKFFPITHEYSDSRFFLNIDGKLFATPLFVVLLLIETTDVVFALDSIPVILGITTDPFIVYSSNIFAILGLRSLYFVLCNLIGLFYYLHYGLAAILIFIGLKMLVADFLHIPVFLTLIIVSTLLFLTIALSIFFPPSKIK